VPSNDYCFTHTNQAMIAICWDQVTHTNPAVAGPWCTYKDIPMSACTGGPNPGIIWVCLEP
jgi:hypothetical protein